MIKVTRERNNETATVFEHDFFKIEQNPIGWDYEFIATDKRNGYSEAFYSLDAAFGFIINRA